MILRETNKEVRRTEEVGYVKSKDGKWRKKSCTCMGLPTNQGRCVCGLLTKRLSFKYILDHENAIKEYSFPNWRLSLVPYYPR